MTRTANPQEAFRFDERVDPELAARLAALPALDVSELAAARKRRDELAAAARQAWRAPAGVAISDQVIDGAPPVRVRTYRPTSDRSTGACLYWVHGGGHVMGGLDQDDPFLSDLVNRVGCTAVSVDWRLSPEAPFPAALDDAYSGLAWVAGQAHHWGVDPLRVVVGGASSGGGLAAGLVLLARDRGEPAVAAQVLVYPMLDDRGITTSGRSVVHPQLWNRRNNELAWRHYLGPLTGTEDVPPYAAPARATDLHGLPRTWIATGELDLFADENIDYASRLMAAGVSTELHVYAGAFHGFDLLVPDASVSQRYRRERDEALYRFLGPDTPRAGSSVRSTR